ncbi:hypothetical protein PENSPDRAFT_659609 [Peniophora sp. CONT]|nr:hypothetical protein PENSPDRAFT_659609 [Peniophora sp. CONT]
MVLINENGDTTGDVSSTPILVAPCSVQQLDWNYGIEPYNLSITVNSTQSATQDLVTSYTLREYNWTVVQPVGSTNQIKLYDRTGFVGITSLYQVVSDGRETLDASCLSAASSSVEPSGTSAVTSPSSTSSLSSTSTSPASSASFSRSSASIGAIAGGAAGGGIVLTVILAILICLWRRQRRTRNRIMEIDPGDEGLPSYAEVVMPLPTPLTRSASQSGVSSTLLVSPGAGDKRNFSGEKKPVAISDFSAGQASWSPDSSLSSSSTMRTRNPDADVSRSPASDSLLSPRGQHPGSNVEGHSNV